MAAGTTTYRPVASGLDADGVLTALAQRRVHDRAAGGSRRSPCSTRSTAASPTPVCASSSSTAASSCCVAKGEVPAVVTVATQPRVAADVPAGPLRQRLPRLLDVRALLRLVEVTSQRTEATKRNRAGKVTAAVTVHRTPGDERDRSDDPRPRRGRPSWPAIRSRPRSCSDCSTGLGLERDRGRPRRARRDERRGPARWLRGIRRRAARPPTMSAIDGFRAVLANLRDAMVANWDGTIADIDPEFLHDLRVAVRRTRVVLANAKRVLPEEVRQRAREDFAWFGEITGNGPRSRRLPDRMARLHGRPRRRRDRGAGAAARAPRGRARGRARRAGGPAVVGAGGRGDRSLERMARRPGRPATLGDRGDEALAETVAPAHPPRPSA